MTTEALAAIERLDDGCASPADRLIVEVFDAHCDDDWHRRLTVLDVPPAGFCPLHGERLDAAGDCGSCYVAHDSAMQRVEDQ